MTNTSTAPQIPAPASEAAPLPPLSTTVTGAPTGPGILLAHGATGSIASNYGQLIPVLAASGHRVVAPDYPGSGDTPRATGPLSLDGLADALVAEATANGLETFTLIGFSMGTAVSVRAAARHPERVRGLVLTAGLAKADTRASLWIDLWLRLLERGDYAGFAQARTLCGLAPEYLNGLSPEALQAALDPDPALPPRGSAEQAALVRTLDTTADLPGITVPTLVITTTRDPLVHPSLSRHLADHIPGAEYAEIATGHLPMLERPEEWQGLIAEFLARHRL
ncbi:alpha/beta fold hydrolase [Streptomyces chattanoogensis]|uniref:Alpha/beta hydrolase n=1 Tax=Streptomyces chattanoogensis TaxID=66876 RepID=A0A0N0GVQ8_9ACTN|nr:alpha/beta hydrolase [Streptomyces chattanoogensis]KPC59412.1 alpha/beta hydrolase [Streptomyces chattanoogensis]